MKIPLRRLSNAAAAEMVGAQAYFTRLYNDLTVRKKARNCQHYYLAIINRARWAIEQERESLPLSNAEIAEIENRLRVFQKALDEGNLAQEIDPNLRIYEGGKAGG